MVPFRREFKTPPVESQQMTSISAALMKSWNHINGVGLYWNDAAVAALQGFENTGLKVSDCVEEDNFKKLCREIHREMFKQKIWGKDTPQYNVVFDSLPQDMKENYVLIALVTLAALSGQEEKAPEQHPAEECPMK